jgi:hypothetical protein
MLPIISLLIPTRGRVKNLYKLVENITQTVTNIENIELYLTFDIDDTFTCKAIHEIRNKYAYIRFPYQGILHSDYLNKDYYNEMARLSIGKYLWAIGDDVKFISKNWDVVLKEKIEEYLKDKKDRIAYISVKEKDSTAKHPCFPIITREAYQALEMYFHPELMSWGADRCLYEVYNGIERILHIPEIGIEHLSYHDNKKQIDETAKSVKERFFRNPKCHNEVSQNRVPLDIQRLKEYINGKICL